MDPESLSENETEKICISIKQWVNVNIAFLGIVVIVALFLYAIIRIFTD